MHRLSESDDYLASDCAYAQDRVQERALAYESVSIILASRSVDTLTGTHVPNNGELDLIRGIFLGALCDFLDEALRNAILELGVL